MAEGERGMLTLQLLFKQFYVDLCSLFEHMTKNYIDKSVANWLYQGPRGLIIGEVNYSLSVAASRSAQSRL